MENTSRHGLLYWVNATIRGHYTKIEQLCNGVAYCKMMEKLFPNCIGMRRVRIYARLEHEYLQNWKLLQNALTRLKFDKPIPIERLLKGRFQDNLEFLQWFKKFYDDHCVVEVKSLSEDPSSSGACGGITVKPITVQTLEDTFGHLEVAPIRPSPTVKSLQEDIRTIKGLIKAADFARTNYYNKLQKIEKLIRLNERNHPAFCKSTTDVLYAPEDDVTSIGGKRVFTISDTV